MKKLCMILFLVFLTNTAWADEIAKKGQYSVIYKNPIALIAPAKAQQDLNSKIAEVYPNHRNKQKALLHQGMQDYEYLCRPNDDASLKILGELAKIYYPHFTTIKLLYDQKIRACRK